MSDHENDDFVDGDDDDSESKVMNIENFSTHKHPLQHSWTMWYDSPNTSSTKAAPSTGHAWQQGIKKIVSFSSVEDFWCLFNNLMKPSNLPIKGNYHLFKEGVMPAWEDPANAQGGKWVVEFERRQSEILNQVWLYTSLALIGEQFDDMDDITGCVISCRKARNRLGLWTKTAMSEDVQNRIGSQFRKIMEVPERMKVCYQPHSDSLKRIDSRQVTGSGRNLYEV